MASVVRPLKVDCVTQERTPPPSLPSPLSPSLSTHPSRQWRLCAKRGPPTFLQEADGGHGGTVWRFGPRRITQPSLCLGYTERLSKVHTCQGSEGRRCSGRVWQEAGCLMKSVSPSGIFRLPIETVVLPTWMCCNVRGSMLCQLLQSFTMKGPNACSGFHSTHSV